MNHKVDENAPAELRALDVLVGKWRMGGEVDGETTFAWMRGGHFLEQVARLTQGGETHHSTEVIGYEKPFMGERVDQITSRAYTDTGDTLDYTWELEGDVLTIWGGPKGSPAYARSEISGDGTRMTGAWHWPGGGYEFTAEKIG